MITKLSFCNFKESDKSQRYHVIHRLIQPNIILACYCDVDFIY